MQRPLMFPVSGATTSLRRQLRRGLILAAKGIALQTRRVQEA